MKRFKRLAAAVLTAVMAVTASATALAADTGKYAQFYKASDSSAVSMVQKAVDTTTVTAESYTDDDENVFYDLSFNVSEFTITMTVLGATISGSGYMTAVTLTNGTDTYTGEVTTYSDDTKDGTITIEGIPEDMYNALISGTMYSATVDYYVAITSGNYTHTDSEALFTLSSVYNAY